MCFHTAQTKKVTELEKRYQASISKSDARDAYDIPRYHMNGFAHPDMLIIPQEEPSILAPALWGIVPSNKTAGQISSYYKEAVRYGGGLNAQSEKLFNHFIYKHAAFTRRCIVPVTGFYEPHEYEKKKYPFHIKHKDDDVLSLAGLYTIIGEAVTFTILTKAASPLFAKIHNKKNRQPIILHEQLEQEWLKDSLSEKNIQDIINEDFPEQQLSAYTVSKDLFSPKVNSDTPDILEEIKYEGVVV